MMAKKAAKRQLLDTGPTSDTVRRNQNGHFKESDDVGRSLATDRCQHAKTKVPKGQGDKGDRQCSALAARGLLWLR